MSDDDIKRHFDVVAERMEKRFDLPAEAVQHLDSKIDRKTDALDRKLDELTVETRTAFRELAARIDVSVAQLSDHRGARTEPLRTRNSRRPAGSSIRADVVVVSR